MAQINILLKLLNAVGVNINPATEDTLASVKAKTDNLDVLLSTRTKPADQQHAVVDSSALPAGAATSAKQLPDGHNVTVAGVVAVSNLPATQPVSGTVTVANPTANPETGLAKDATLAAQSAKLPATLGQKASAASLAAVLSTEQEAILSARATEATLANRNNDIATLLNLLPNSATKKTMRLSGHGINGQMSYHLRNASSALPDAATWDALRFRIVGPSSAMVATYTRSGTTVTVTTTTAHNLETDDLAYHTSPTDTGIEKYRRVTVTDATHYTFQTAATGANGAITLNPNGAEVKYRTGVTPTANLETGW